MEKLKKKNVAASFMSKNKRLKIIDVTKGLTIKRDEEELWLCPSNYLMLAQNIKNELLDYTSSTLLKQEIIENYDKLKLIISTYFLATEKPCSKKITAKTLSKQSATIDGV